MKLFFLNFIYSFNDMPYNWQYRLQDPATPIAESMLAFHNYIMFFLILIFFFVLWMLFASLFFFKNNKRPYQFVHSSDLEAIWTIIPAIILVLIAIPSFSLLFSLEQRIRPAFTLKVIGHQWYWTYQMGGLWKYVSYISKGSAVEYKDAEFECYLKPVEDFRRKGLVRLLDTDVRLVLPKKVYIKVLVTSVDVLHSWAVPSFGIKIDACPGRLNQVSLYIQRSGLYYGQCSEICGVNHAFMPISIKVVSFKKFLLWYQFFIDNSNNFLIKMSEKPFEGITTYMDFIKRPTSEISTDQKFFKNIYYDLESKTPVFVLYNPNKQISSAISQFSLVTKPCEDPIMSANIEYYYRLNKMLERHNKILELSSPIKLASPISFNIKELMASFKKMTLAVPSVEDTISSNNEVESSVSSVENTVELVVPSVEDTISLPKEEESIEPKDLEVLQELVELNTTQPENKD